MVKALLILLITLLATYITSIYAVSTECILGNNEKEKDEATEKAPLHHIIEFGKRDQIKLNGCGKKNKTESNVTKPSTVLGLHGLLHVRSQKSKQEMGTRKGEEPLVAGPPIISKVKEQGGSKRTNTEEKQLHKLQLRAETISMLHKIVEKYFPGGHLTVDQKIKALKILGKIIKLKKEGKAADIKVILDSFPKKQGKSLTVKTTNNTKSPKENSKVEGDAVNKISRDKADVDGEKTGGDIYANIANGPDIPKLPPSVSEKDPDHAHSNIMPIGVQPTGGEGGFMNPMGHPNDISDDIRDSLEAKMGNFQSQYDNEQYSGSNLGLGQIYNTGNRYNNRRMGLSSMPMMDEQGETRGRMPFSLWYRHKGLYGDGAGRRYAGDGDWYDDDDDEDVDEDEETGRARSYVHRHDDDYDDDDENDDENDEDDDEDGDDEAKQIVYSRRYGRNRIAQTPKRNKTAKIRNS